MTSMLMQLDLTGRTCVDRAIARLREFESPEGYWLAFSGGKDSVALKALADMAGVRYEAHHNLTTIDPPPLVRFIRRRHPDVAVHAPTGFRNFYEAVEAKGLPIGKFRWCCEVFKHRGGEDRVRLFGLRAAESRRSGLGRGVVQLCARTGARNVNPLWDWSAAEVWSFIRSREVAYCRLYDEGYDRLGCVCCPYAPAAEIVENRRRWTWMFERIRRAVRRRWEAHWRDTETATRFTGPDAMFEWWLTCRRGCMPPPGAYWNHQQEGEAPDEALHRS